MVRVALALMLCVAFLATPAEMKAQDALDPAQAGKMAEMMCRQLPNLTDVHDAVIQIPNRAEEPEGPEVDPVAWDDVYDVLIDLGQYSVPCLVDEMTDTRWMPDPRMEPLLGAPVVGDVAYMVLGEKGVPDLLPGLAHKKPDQLRMDDYFVWPSLGDNRVRLQQAVRDWLLQHPSCCAAPWIVRNSQSPKPSFRTTPAALLAARKRFKQLRPGMGSAQVIKIVGRPDAEQHASGEQASNPAGEDLHLLGICSSNRNEQMAYIYFIERWTSDIAQRDPLRDRYLILYFSSEGKLTRMFSNVADIPPVFPHSEKEWLQVMWGGSPQENSPSPRPAPERK